MMEKPDTPSSPGGSTARSISCGLQLSAVSENLRTLGQVMEHHCNKSRALHLYELITESQRSIPYGRSNKSFQNRKSEKCVVVPVPS